MKRYVRGRAAASLRCVSRVKGSTEEEHINEKGRLTELQEESSGSEAVAGGFPVEG